MAPSPLGGGGDGGRGRGRRWRFLCLPLLLLLPLEAAADSDLRSIKVKVNPMSEEETLSQVMPESYVCDACKIVVYRVNEALSKVRPKDPAELRRNEALGRKLLQEQAGRITESLEEACDSETYNDYGVKEVDGVKSLHGPGHEIQGAGTIQGSARWASRLKARCAALVEETGEGELAALWRTGGLTAEALCDECGGGGRPKKERRRKRPAPRPRKDGFPAPPPPPKAPATGLEELPPPPYAMEALTPDTFDGFIDRKSTKFKFVVFHDADSRSASALQILELAARELRKAKEAALRKVIVGRFDSSGGDVRGYRFSYLPRALLWRKGYKNPKAFDGEWVGPQAVVDWLRSEVRDLYMKDDPDKYPRAEL